MFGLGSAATSPLELTPQYLSLSLALQQVGLGLPQPILQPALRTASIYLSPFLHACLQFFVLSFFVLWSWEQSGKGEVKVEKAKQLHRVVVPTATK